MNNSFKNCGGNYRAVVFTPNGLGEFRLAEVEHRDAESTYQTVDTEYDLVLGVFEKKLRLAGPDFAKVVTFADPLAKHLFKDHPWLYDWLYSRQKGIPEKVVPKERYMINELRKKMMGVDCSRWGLPVGIVETLAARPDTFNLRVSGKMADLRRAKLPAGTLLFGLVRKGTRAERILSVDGYNLVHGYPYLIEVTPRTGEVVVHTNNKVRADAQDWVADLSHWQKTRPVTYLA